MAAKIRSKLGILGGTFDPPHWGHLAMAEAAHDQMQLDRVLWVPSHRPPHKSANCLSAFEIRRDWVRRAIADRSEFALVEVAGRSSGASYAIDTLRALQRMYPDRDWCWIVGLDTFRSLPKWYKCQEVASVCQWSIAPRARCSHSQAQAVAATQQACREVARLLEARSISIRWQVLEMSPIDISSSEIRRSCREGRSIRNWVPESIRADLETHPF
ncbi:MAG TPA: nicotinate (nicotinamide) nucleotide adenylyltransferase [Oscillatoriales cyanobacterium M59_W2019_021]|nr:MAG: nicotinate (nicotinamide) nucleotide adenylyltransferase [Cyanobacteria bacterium J055]HIK30720.1 nicotinate (nicotinamide) nucleotide adenylyltransferase [Oscillatoriales cyanobacterium M4454_W2019_049]HIK51906.1 nicotinate (nicotinamide) nucleotide adenylyltransferase [Oscillatoriales cyanobacterium M59_W2019_021]